VVGGATHNVARSVAVDAFDRIIVCGSMAFNPDLTTVSNLFQTAVNGAQYSDVIQGGAPTC
jgi:hypothetical protein